MTDYTELIRSLRNCSNNRCAPCYCGWFDKYQVDESCKEIIMWKAADAIEALQAEIRESLQRCAECGDELAQQMQKRGEFVYVRGDGVTCCDGWECSVCGKTYHTNVPYFGEYKFCPNCGAKMEVQDG